MTSSIIPKVCKPSPAGALAALTPVVLFVLFFVPKVNVLALPGFTVQVKPEDLLWLCMLPILLMSTWRLSMGANRAWLLLLSYLTISALWYPSNLLLVLRFIFYSIPFLIVVNLQPRHQGLMKRMAVVWLYLMAVLGVLQTVSSVPYFHTGEIALGPIDRAPGLYGNGVEFALMALICFWLTRFLGDRSPWTWIALLAITAATGTRMVMLMGVFSGLVLVQNLPLRLKSMAIVAGIAFSLLAWSLMQRNVSDDSVKAESMTAAVLLAKMFEPVSASDLVSSSDGYCFEFDYSLSTDQSLAMRLSKLMFVVKHVVLGDHPLGFGLGKCIGDAGDNLYVRTLSDGGLPYLALLLVFLLASYRLPIASNQLRKTWHLFLIILVIVSVFYDTFYFSRVSPLIFYCYSIVYAQRR